MTIKLQNISYTVSGYKILDNVSLEIKEGEVLSLIGPNGAGKSTLLNAATGDLDPSLGTVYYNHQNLEELNIVERSFYRAVMSQSQQIVFDFSVQEIIEMGWIEKGFSNYSKDFDDAVKEVSMLCNLENLLKRKFNKLSGGEQRRVHFARTLLQLWRPSNSKDPLFMLLDEPTANLDLYYEIKMMEIIKLKASEGIGVFLILHDLNLAARYSDRIAIISEGSLIKIDTPQSVLDPVLLKKIYNLDMTIDKKTMKVSYF
tara:strand:+ start:9345 stop:10118 length:774 start_codon:yes stop_codon:yes gene_type:complete